MKSPKPRPRRVALVIETTRAYGRRIIEGIMRYVKEHEPWLMEMEPRALADPLPQRFKEWSVDGMIVRLVDAGSLRALQRAPIPVVHLKSEIRLPGGEGVPIRTDQDAIGRLGAQHFAERGFRHFGFVGSPGLAWSDGRLRGFSAAVRALGGTCAVYERRRSRHWNAEGLPGPDAGRVAAWVRSLPRPVGLLAADDFVGLNLLNACQQYGIAVPDEVAVLGVDDEESLCRFSVPPLSSIIPDNSRLGYQAAELLDLLMKGTPGLEPKPLLIPPLGIRVRESSDTVAVEDAVVASAMAFIRTQACAHITTEDVARHAGLACSTLSRRFSQVLGRPVYETILQVKLDTVKMLLVETDLCLKEISHRTGFRHVEHLATLFKRRTGQTLLEFREHQRR
jgi:LacI family transcriptional regulator